jgi:hypothetical protein
MIRRLLLIAPLALLFASRPWARAVLADDGFLGAVGSSVVPLDSDQIAMVAERVEATLDGDEVRVTCVFTFTNSGPATQVLMGFPEKNPDQWMGGRPELLDFTAEVDGTDLPVAFRLQATPEPRDSEHGGYDYRGWHAFTVPFTAGETRVVRNTYRGGLGGVSDGSQFFEYVLASGASWRGTIGDAIVRIKWLDEGDVLPDSVYAEPAGMVLEERSATWRFEDIEPSNEHNVVFSYQSAGSATAMAEYWATDAADRARLDMGSPPTSVPPAAATSTPVAPAVEGSVPASTGSRGRLLGIVGAVAMAAVLATLAWRRRSS